VLDRPPTESNEGVIRLSLNGEVSGDLGRYVILSIIYVSRLIRLFVNVPTALRVNNVDIRPFIHAMVDTEWFYIGNTGHT
jgi:hypothetical protein